MPFVAYTLCTERLDVRVLDWIGWSAELALGVSSCILSHTFGRAIANCRTSAQRSTASTECPQRAPTLEELRDSLCDPSFTLIEIVDTHSFVRHSCPDGAHL
jgi:hypothetical protein